MGKARSLRVPLTSLRAGEMELDAEESKYVVKVHRLGPGQPLSVFDPEAGLEAEAVIVSDRLPHVRVSLSEVREASDASLPLTLLQALGKGDKPEQAVRDATALGAQRIVFVTTERTVPRTERLDRLRKIAVQVARQCGRGRIPVILGPVPLSEMLAEMLKERAPEGGLRFVCSFEEDAAPLLARIRGSDLKKTPSAVLIGPEGGLSSLEVDEARRGGFVPVSLGPLVLRTEQACTFVLSALRAAAEGQ